MELFYGLVQQFDGLAFHAIAGIEDKNDCAPLFGIVLELCLMSCRPTEGGKVVVDYVAVARIRPVYRYICEPGWLASGSIGSFPVGMVIARSW